MASFKERRKTLKTQRNAVGGRYGTHTECVFVGNGVMAKEVNENIKFESTFESGNKSEVAH